MNFSKGFERQNQSILAQNKRMSRVTTLYVTKELKLNAQILESPRRAGRKHATWEILDR